MTKRYDISRNEVPDEPEMDTFASLTGDQAEEIHLWVQRMIKAGRWIDPVSQT